MRNKVDTEQLMRTMIHAPSPVQTEQAGIPDDIAHGKKEENAESEKVTRGRKPNAVKNIQISVYLRPDQAKELRIQDAMREKENDKSALARMGIDIALQMSSDVYREMKTRANAAGIRPGELIEAALRSYLHL